MTAVQERLRKALDENKERYIRHLAELVAIDTHDIGHGIDGGLEAKGQDYMCELYRQLGAADIVRDQMEEAVIQQGIRDHQEGNPGHNYDGRCNVYATFEGTSDRSMLFNGHIDTMPVGERAQWDSEPHTPTLREGRLYGLGVCDMKAGLVAPAMAVDLLAKAGIPLPGRVVLTSVVDEEGGGNGSIQAAMRGVGADAAVVCEPTDYRLLIANMGFVFFEVEVAGKPVHSASKWLGVNAIGKAQKIMAAIDELEHRWLLTYKHPLLPPPSSNVGVISGGSAGSTVADRCVFKTCVHYIPGQMAHDQVVREYREAIDLCCDGDAWLREHRPRVSIYQYGGPFEMDAAHPLVASFSRAYRASLGKPVQVLGSPAGCDARVWRNVAAMPTIQYGPGRQSECHVSNEYIDIQQYLDAILIYANLMMDWMN